MNNRYIAIKTKAIIALVSIFAVVISAGFTNVNLSYASDTENGDVSQNENTNVGDVQTEEQLDGQNLGEAQTPSQEIAVPDELEPSVGVLGDEGTSAGSSEDGDELGQESASDSEPNQGQEPQEQSVPIQPLGTNTQTSVFFRDWWLRTPTNSRCDASTCAVSSVNADGRVFAGGGFDVIYPYAVRPALFINLSPIAAYKSSLQVGTCDGGTDTGKNCIVFGGYAFDVIGINSAGSKSGVCSTVPDGGYTDNDGAECPNNTVALLLSNASENKLGTSIFRSPRSANAWNYFESSLNLTMNTAYTMVSTLKLNNNSANPTLSSMIVSRSLAGGAAYPGNSGVNVIAGAGVTDAHFFPLSATEANQLYKGTVPAPPEVNMPFTCSNLGTVSGDGTTLTIANTSLVTSLVTSRGDDVTGDLWTNESGDITIDLDNISTLCSGATKLVISNAEVVGNYTFRNNVTSLKINQTGSAITELEIGDNAFEQYAGGSNSLTSVTFPESLTALTIGDNAFKQFTSDGSNALSSVIFPEGLETLTIGDNAFKQSTENGTNALTSFIFPTDSAPGNGEDSVSLGSDITLLSSINKNLPWTWYGQAGWTGSAPGGDDCEGEDCENLWRPNVTAGSSSYQLQTAPQVSITYDKGVGTYVGIPVADDIFQGESFTTKTFAETGFAAPIGTHFAYWCKVELAGSPLGCANQSDRVGEGVSMTIMSTVTLYAVYQWDDLAPANFPVTAATDAVSNDAKIPAINELYKYTEIAYDVSSAESFATTCSSLTSSQSGYDVFYAGAISGTTSGVAGLNSDGRFVCVGKVPEAGIVGSKTMPITILPVTTKRILTVDFSGLTFDPKAYDGTTTITPASGSVSLKYNGEIYNAADRGISVACTYTHGDKNVGNNKAITASCSLDGSSNAAKHTIANPNSIATGKTVDIMKQSITVSGVTAQNKEYDGNRVAVLDLSSASFDPVAHYGDTIALTGCSGEFSGKDASYSPIAVAITLCTLTGQDSSNYQLSAQPSGATAYINPRPVTVTAPDYYAKVGDDLDGRGASAGSPVNNAIISNLAPGETFSIPVYLKDSTECMDSNQTHEGVPNCTYVVERSVAWSAETILGSNYTVSSFHMGKLIVRPKFLDKLIDYATGTIVKDLPAGSATIPGDSCLAVSQIGDGDAWDAFDNDTLGELHKLYDIEVQNCNTHVVWEPDHAVEVLIPDFLKDTSTAFKFYHLHFTSGDHSKPERIQEHQALRATENHPDQPIEPGDTGYETEAKAIIFTTDRFSEFGVTYEAAPSDCLAGSCAGGAGGKLDELSQTGVGTTQILLLLMIALGAAMIISSRIQSNNKGLHI